MVDCGVNQGRSWADVFMEASQRKDELEKKHPENLSENERKELQVLKRKIYRMNLVPG